MHFELDGAGLIPSEEDQPHHPPQPCIESHPVNRNLLHPDLILNLSRSDPHLNLAGLFHFDDSRPLAHVVSGLVDHPATLPDSLHLMNKPTNPLFSAVNGPSLNTSASSAALLDPTPQQTGAPLRKSSSAIDWTLFSEFGKETPTLQQLAERPGAFLEGARKKSSNHFGFSALSLLGAHKEEQGGLVMTTPSSAPSTVDRKPQPSMFSALTSHSGSNSLVSAASMALQGSSSNHAVTPSVSSSNPLQQSPSTSSTASAPPALQAATTEAAAPPANDHKHGMLGSVLNRGFLGRPVLRTDEESYRYIMALDR